MPPSHLHSFPRNMNRFEMNRGKIRQASKIGQSRFYSLQMNRLQNEPQARDFGLLFRKNS